MDGDQRMKQHERFMPRSANPAARGRATHRFDPAMHPRGGDPTGMSQSPDRAQMSYDYAYTNSSVHGGSLQANEAGSYGSELTRPRAMLSTASQAVQQSQQQRRRAAPEQSSFVPYESALLYGFGQQGSGAGAGPAQGSFEVVPQYSTRQSAAMEALSNQFAVPQYFAPEEHPATGVPGGLSPYLNPHLPYNHPGPIPRSTSSQPFPVTMTDFTSIESASSARLDPPSMGQTEEPPQQPEPDPSSLDEAYSQYQRALCSIFDDARAGRLVDASRSLLEISEWLVTNARDLGKFGFFLVFFYCGTGRYTASMLGCVVVPNRTLDWTLFPP